MITIKQIKNRFNFLLNRLGKEEGNKEGQWRLCNRDMRVGGYEILEVTNDRGGCRVVASGCSKREFNSVLDGMHAMLDLQEMEAQNK